MSPSQVGPAGDSMAVVRIDPALPAALSHDEKVTVFVRYHLVSEETAILLVRPYTRGRQSSGYVAHMPVVCKNGPGKADGWFSFRSDAEVDEIRVTMVDNAKKRLLVSVTNRVQATWGTP